MLYESSVITDYLKCHYCTQSFIECDPPRILPCCGKTICKKCVRLIHRQMKNKTYKCIVCKEKSVMPSKGLMVNEAVVKLVSQQPKNIDRDSQTEKRKSSLIDLGNLADKLSAEMKNIKRSIKEHCNELRKEVELATEERINEIKYYTKSMIHTIDRYERECLQNYVEINHSKHEAQEIFNQVKSFFQQQKPNNNQQLRISCQEAMDTNDKLNELKKRVDEERVNLKRLMLNNQLLKFEPNTSPATTKILGEFKYERINFNVGCFYFCIVLVFKKTFKCIIFCVFLF